MLSGKQIRYTKDLRICFEKVISFIFPPEKGFNMNFFRMLDSHARDF